MENVEKKECGGCGEGKCGCGGAMGSMCKCHGKYYHLVKVILKLIIIIIIFWCGFKLGVITGSIRGGYYGHTNFGMMRGGGYALPDNGGAPTPTTPAQ